MSVKRLVLECSLVPALFTQNLTQPKGPLTGEWMNSVPCICTMDLVALGSKKEGRTDIPNNIAESQKN